MQQLHAKFASGHGPEVDYRGSYVHHQVRMGVVGALKSEVVQQLDGFPLFLYNLFSRLDTPSREAQNQAGA